MNNAQKISLALITLAMLYILVRCTIMEPSQSLSDIQKPEEAVSNAPTAASQRDYEKQMKGKE